jgi:hypothetical protein
VIDNTLEQTRAAADLATSPKQGMLSMRSELTIGPKSIVPGSFERRAISPNVAVLAPMRRPHGL